MKKLLIAISISLLAGCAGLNAPETPAQKVYVAHTVYDGALSVAIAYKRLPPCPQAVICSEKEVIAVLQKADIVAFEALSTAQTAVRTTGQSLSSLETAVFWAQEAIAAFSRITNSLRTK